MFPPYSWELFLTWCRQTAADLAVFCCRSSAWTLHCPEGFSASDFLPHFSSGALIWSSSPVGRLNLYILFDIDRHFPNLMEGRYYFPVFPFYFCPCRFVLRKKPLHYSFWWIFFCNNCNSASLLVQESVEKVTEIPDSTHVPWHSYFPPQKLNYFYVVEILAKYINTPFFKQ